MSEKLIDLQYDYVKFFFDEEGFKPFSRIEINGEVVDNVMRIILNAGLITVVCKNLSKVYPNCKLHPDNCKVLTEYMDFVIVFNKERIGRTELAHSGKDGVIKAFYFIGRPVFPIGLDLNVSGHNTFGGTLKFLDLEIVTNAIGIACE